MSTWTGRALFPRQPLGGPRRTSGPAWYGYITDAGEGPGRLLGEGRPGVLREGLGMGEVEGCGRDPLGGSASNSGYGERAQAGGGPYRTGQAGYRLYVEALVAQHKLMQEYDRIINGELPIWSAEDYEYFVERTDQLSRLFRQSLRRCQRRWEML
jgi:hypothetical protein